MDRSDITGLVLAGGRGSRMENADKGLLPLLGKPMVAYAIERLAPQVGSLLVSANRNHSAYAAFGHPVLADAEPSFAGPLAGVLAGLRACKTRWLAVVPCDSPELPADLVERLAAAAQATASPVAAARTAHGTQPVFCLIDRSLLTSLERFLAAGGRKVEDWQHSAGVVHAEFDDPAAFTNLNTPADFRNLEGGGE